MTDESTLTPWQQSRERARALRAAWVASQHYDHELYAPGARGRFGERRRFYGPRRVAKGWRDTAQVLDAARLPGDPRGSMAIVSSVGSRWALADRDDDATRSRFDARRPRDRRPCTVPL